MRMQRSAMQAIFYIAPGMLLKYFPDTLKLKVNVMRQVIKWRDKFQFNTQVSI